MIDFTLDDNEPPATQYPAGLPSFVQYRETAPDWQIDHWCPEVTGFDPVDFKRGKQHAATAIAFARKMGDQGINFLLAVVCSMQFRPTGAIERGFIAGLVPLALAGTLPPAVSDGMMAEAAAFGADMEQLRNQEAFMQKAIRGGSAAPRLFFNYVVELIEGPREFWAGAAIHAFVGAALNGGRN